MSDVAGGAQGGQQLGRALGPGLGGDDVDVPGGAHRPILPQPGPPGEPRASCGIVPAMAPEASWPALDLLFESHPWHGVAIGPDAPRQVTVYVEIVPSDTVKYELDKDSGLLKVDRPAALLERLPEPVRLRAAHAVQRPGGGARGGEDGPARGSSATTTRSTSSSSRRRTSRTGTSWCRRLPIGGLGMLDGSEVDDKIVAVMVKDAVYGGVQDISHLPTLLVDRLKHYFLTYKQAPSEAHAGLRAHPRLRARGGLRGDPPQPGRLPGPLRRDAGAAPGEGIGPWRRSS